MQVLFWETKPYLIDINSKFLYHFHGAGGMRVTGAVTFNHINKGMNWVLNVKHTGHPSKHNCSFMHAFTFHLFYCIHSVGLQLIKRWKSTPLSSQLQSRSRLQTHLETNVISTSSIPFVHDRQLTDSCSYRFKTNNDFLSRKYQGTAWVPSALKRTAQCQLTLVSSYLPNVVLRSTLLNTHDKRKTLLLVPPSAKIMGFLCLSSHDTGATSKKVTILLWAHSSHSVGFYCRHPWGLYWVYLTTSPELIWFLCFSAAVFLMCS